MPISRYGYGLIDDRQLAQSRFLNGLLQDDIYHIRRRWGDSCKVNGVSVNDMLKYAEEAEKRGDARSAEDWLKAALFQQDYCKREAKKEIEEVREKYRKMPL